MSKQNATYTPRVVPCLPASRAALDVLFRRWSAPSPAGLVVLGGGGWRSLVIGKFSERGRLAIPSLLRSPTGERLGGLASRPVPPLRRSADMWLVLDAASALPGTTTFERYGGDLFPVWRNDPSAGGGAASLWDGFQPGGLRCLSGSRSGSCSAGPGPGPGPGIDAKVASRCSILSWIL